MVDSREAVVAGEVVKVPVIVGAVTNELSHLVVRSSSYDFIIWRPSMKDMRTTFDFDKYVATFRSDRKVTEISLVTEYSTNMPSINDKFTSENNDSSLGSGEKSNDEESSDGELVMTISKRPAMESVTNDEDMFTRSLEHLGERHEQTIYQSLTKNGSIVA